MMIDSLDLSERIDTYNEQLAEDTLHARNITRFSTTVRLYDCGYVVTKLQSKQQPATNGLDRPVRWQSR